MSQIIKDFGLVNLSQLDQVAREILNLLEIGSTVILTGDLGAGKTTFTQTLGKILGVTQAIDSPTYILMQDFATEHFKFKTLRHLDLYRVENYEELKTRKLTDWFKLPDGLVLIEWGEKFKIPAEYQITISVVDGAEDEEHQRKRQIVLIQRN